MTLSRMGGGTVLLVGLAAGVSKVSGYIPYDHGYIELRNHTAQLVSNNLGKIFCTRGDISTLATIGSDERLIPSTSTMMLTADDGIFLDIAVKVCLKNGGKAPEEK